MSKKQWKSHSCRTHDRPSTQAKTNAARAHVVTAWVSPEDLPGATVQSSADGTLVAHRLTSDDRLLSCWLRKDRDGSR